MIRKNVSLKSFNTFGLDYKADCIITLESEESAAAFFNDRESGGKPLLILGGGSNVLFTSDFRGTILLPAFGGIRLEEMNGPGVVVSAGAGVKWDDFVEWCVSRGYGGVENLSLIPGSVGAAPIQNIGAYGTEIRETVIKLKAISIADGSVTEFSNAQCRFGYRESVFKNEKKGKFLITRVYFKLETNPGFNTSYNLLREEVEKLGGESLRNVRDAVINIRRRKLPDPEVYGNAGSFFKNPVVSLSVAGALKAIYPSMPAFADHSGGVKLAGGWLIEQCGWKGKRAGDAGVHDKQALVLVNHGKATGQELYDLSEEIRKSVMEKFGVCLEREIEVIGIT
ncbi:MAG: UDP-N-acetylmuramate dehydrogenase [Bacteroidales bacterium]|nr:UDP-N-acetylmuramate dehydrogenase [Bacteroidales bacterium]